MAGLFGLSVDPTVYKGNFSEDLFWGTFYQQHLGEEYAGLSTSDGQTIRVQTHRGLFRPTFSTNLKELKGAVGLTEGTGYCGSDREPFLVESKVGEWSVCFSGNVINLAELVERFKNFGHIFEKRGERITDIEVLAKLIAQGESIIDGIGRMEKEIKGAFCLLVLTKEGIFAARSSIGHWPLVIGQKEGAVVIASEPGGFCNNGFKLVRDIEPGEIIFAKDGRWEQKRIMPNDGRIQICSFIWVYTAFANGVFERIPASLVRKKLGAALARRDIEKGFIPDIVAPVPDSGKFHAMGYFGEFCRQVNAGVINKLPQYDEVLLKYPYAGRSFMPQTKEVRDEAAHIKLVISGEDYSGKIVVICDDSIVRGTQTQTNLVPKLKALGIAEIHFRISNPELLSHCPWGKTTKKGETLASRLPDKKDRIKFLGIKSLEYCTIEDLVLAIGLPRELLCVDCSLKSD